MTHKPLERENCVFKVCCPNECPRVFIGKYIPLRREILVMSGYTNSMSHAFFQNTPVLINKSLQKQITGL